MTKIDFTEIVYRLLYILKIGISEIKLAKLSIFYILVILMNEGKVNIIRSVYMSIYSKTTTLSAEVIKLKPLHVSYFVYTKY